MLYENFSSRTTNGWSKNLAGINQLKINFIIYSFIVYTTMFIMIKFLYNFFRANGNADVHWFAKSGESLNCYTLNKFLMLKA